jgi:hypothetical protein
MSGIESKDSELDLLINEEQIKCRECLLLFS